VSYNIARIIDERVSTAYVESSVDELVNSRMCKKHQMCGSALCAQLHLHVRIADLNARSRNYVRFRPQPYVAANNITLVAMVA
jgi:hypothetical protein